MRQPLIWLLAAAALLGALAMLNALPLQECGLPTTRIHEIQGNEARSPLTGETVTISGVVIGDFRGEGELGGFFVQEEDADIDGDPSTSEGLFVEFADPFPALPVGRVVCVTGTVAERHGSTRLRQVTDLRVGRRTAIASPAKLTLPLAAAGTLESMEGMRITHPGILTVTGTYGLGRYGELILAPERLAIPTSVVLPGSEACAVADENDRLRIRLDDGLSVENPDPVRYPSGESSPDLRVRAGDTVEDLAGILHEDRRGYGIQPTSDPVFSFAPRPDTTPAVTGRLRIVGFNVENYFNGNGDGTGFPTTRGAASAQEFARQRAKVVSALSALAPDIIGLCEIENDGYGTESAIGDLVRGLNEATDPQVTYDYVVPSTDRLGDDDISVALVYRTETVHPLGDPLSPETFSPLTRMPLAQVFEESSSGERLTVVVNHFKSRSTSRAIGGNRDQGDEQGCWNLRRTESAEELLAWLAEADLGSIDPDILLIGDYNAYPHEDPIQLLAASGFVDLLSLTGQAQAYTYVYDGEAGAIDLALASASLASQVTATGIWHINADESTLFDYRTRYKSPSQIALLYSESPYRSSDHDPVIVGIDLAGSEP